MPWYTDYLTQTWHSGPPPTLRDPRISLHWEKFTLQPGPKRLIPGPGQPGARWRVDPWPYPQDQPDDGLLGSVLHTLADIPPEVKALGRAAIQLESGGVPVDDFFDLSSFASGDGQFVDFSVDPTFDPSTVDVGAFDPGGIDAGILDPAAGMDLGGVDLSGLGDAMGGIPSIGSSGLPARISSGLMHTSLSSGGSPMQIDDSGNVVHTGMGSAMAAGGIWLGTYLARALGRGASAAVFTAANGVKVRLAQLWPLVRQYGPTAVAGALGIGAAGLGELLARAPTRGTSGRRGRGRGISARDVRVTKRTIKQLRKMTRMAGIGGGGRSYRSYAPRGRRPHYHRFY